MCNSNTLKLPSTLLLLTLLILILQPPQTQSKQSKPCTAGITFLKTFTNTPPNNNNNNPPSKITQYQHKLINTTDSTYTIQITYPCGSTPLQKIEKLKTQVHDPFISFYLISNSNKKGSRFKRLAKDYGSGDYDDDNEDDDEDDDGDDDDDEEDEEGDEDEQVFTHHHHNNEIEDNNELLIYPSNHVIPNLPTPIVQEYSNDHVMETPVYYYSVQPTTTAMISPTRSISNYVQESTSMGVAYTSTTATSTLNGDDEIIFSNPQLGSGDGPVVVSSTPVYNPVEEYSSSTTTTDEFVTTTTGDYYSSSSSATPSLKSHHHLVHPIAKQLIYSGSPHVFEIPENTLSPPCYEYEIVGGSEVADFVEVVNGSTVRVYPSTTDISDYNLRLSCGRGSGSVVVELFVSVRQRQKSRLYNHEFVVEFGMVRGSGVGGSRVGVVFLVSEFIQRVVGGDNNGFVLLSTELESYPFRVSFVNESIISNVCPVEELKRIYSKLVGVVGSGGQGLMDGGVSLHEDSVIKVERVELRIPPDNNQCGVDTVGKVTGGSGSGSNVYGENYPPTIKNQIDRINGSVGEYLVYPVREDFCYDPEDGGTRGLDVRLKSNELVEIGEEFWLQFDRKNQEFFGLPMGVENREFVLVCSDKSGKSANDVLELQITPPRTPPTEYYTEFSFHFQSIPFTPKNIRKFITKLSTLLSPHIQVSSYSESNSHVLFRYFNTTNPSTEGEVTSIRKVLISDDGPVSKSLVEWFGPEFNVSVVSIVPLRGLLSENNPVGEVEVGEGGGGGGFGLEREDLGSSKGGGGGGGGRYFDFDKDEEVVGGGGSKLDIDHHQNIVNVDNYSGYLTTYIIPSVLIAVMILLALIIACLLSRKNKYTQASTTEDDGVNSRVYLKNAKKGVPVIFQDELDEKLFNNRGELVDGKGSQQQRGNIYEPPPPSSILQQSNANQSSTNTTPQNPTPSRLTSPTPSNPRYPSNNPTGSTTPLPPDYQNSISRSMMRNRPHHQHHHHAPPPGAIQVFPTTATPPQHHHHHHPHDYYTSNRSTPPPIFQQQQQQPPNYQIDAYQPPPGISYYGIHNSNSGGSGFSERTTASGILQPSSQVGSTTPTHVQQQQQPYHHHHHIHQGSNKMAPPPYVPP